MTLHRRQALKVLAASSLGIAACGCHSAPITGRKQLIMMPENQEIALGVQAYQETLSAEPESQDPKIREMVARVGERIAAVAGRDDFQWEFKAIASPQQNAFCLPGGKVAVYEGIIPICESEDGLAVVMSHEVAHALARHGGERMSHSFNCSKCEKHDQCNHPAEGSGKARVANAGLRAWFAISCLNALQSKTRVRGGSYWLNADG